MIFTGCTFCGISMSEAKNWYMDRKFERTLNSLKRNGFKTIYAPTREEAVARVLELIPKDAMVGVGGSMTIRELGLVDMLVQRGNKVVQLFSAGMGASLKSSPNMLVQSDEEIREVIRQELNSDVFLSSSNAITEKGQLVNVDMAGNRVVAMIFGPKRVIVVVGRNKIVNSLDEAMERLRNIASPMNAKRLNRKTPCAVSGVCTDCESPDRLCRVTTIMNMIPARSDITVVLVNEDLGY